MGDPPLPSLPTRGWTAFSKPTSYVGVCNVVSGRKTAAQSAEGQICSGSLVQSTTGVAKPTGVLTIASSRSAMTELLRRETGEVGDPIRRASSS